MSNLALATTEFFEETQCDFYKNGNEEICMTGEQLGICLGYSNPRISINTLVTRNKYLIDNEFSVEINLTSTDGKLYNTRVFTEDGIYEITMLAKTEKAKQFRSWVRKILKGLRKKEITLSDSNINNETLNQLSLITESKQQVLDLTSQVISLSNSVIDLTKYIQQNKQTNTIRTSPSLPDNLHTTKQTVTTPNDSTSYIKEYRSEILKTLKSKYKHLDIGNPYALYNICFSEFENKTGIDLYVELNKLKKQLRKKSLNRMDIIVQSQEWMNIFKDIVVNYGVTKPKINTTNIDNTIINSPTFTTVTEDYYKDLRELAKTKDGFIGDKYVDKIKKLFTTLKNKEVLMQQGCDEKLIFKNFQYEFCDAEQYGKTKSFACFKLTCKETGTYKRIFVCDIQKLQGSKLYLTDCSLIYKFRVLKNNY